MSRPKALTVVGKAPKSLAPYNQLLLLRPSVFPSTPKPLVIELNFFSYRRLNLSMQNRNEKEQSQAVST